MSASICDRSDLYPTATTAAQRLAQDVAMSIFRRRNMTLTFLALPLIMKLPVAEEIKRYRAENPSVVAKIACAYPEAMLFLERATRLVADWLDLLAVAVIISEIQRIVGHEPKFNDRSDSRWIFLGGELRNKNVLRLSDNEAASGDPLLDYVDLYGSRDGTAVMAVYGNSHIDSLYSDDPEIAPGDNGMLHEAFRRLKLSLAA